jgi:hypothetical protein
VATGTVPSTTLPPALGESIERERVIQRQLQRASVQMRLVDLASGMAVWVIGVLVLFIAAALCDHLFGLGTIGRFLALTLLVGGSLWYLARHVVPLLVRTINPAYAALTIEEATPTLKNSLINFLLLRQDKRGIREIVYQAVEQQAAADIVLVPVETTIDRTRLIYAGYCLCGVMAIFAAYKILSPKDPFQTVARVLAPWATIARPSRVEIIEIQPGNGEVYHGQTVQISATIRGVRGTDSVKLHYTTADGQTTDQPIAMKLAVGDRYECLLPPGETAGSAASQGLQQNVAYRVVAGDAESSEYRLLVVSAPTIIIDRLEYQYPAYTKKPAEVVRQQGDIQGIEGTRVTLHAVANQPIKSAWLEMDPAAKEAAGELVTLSADGDQARGTLTLLLKADRLTPWHATYQVRYHNQRSEKSQQPILHKLEVLRDLPPEVQILQPERLRVEVPEDGELTIEVRGVDPDFGLATLRIEGTAAGKPPVHVALLSDPASQPPQATVPYAFRPRAHHLTAGDELIYAAVAEDNRASPQTGQPEPNVARTKEYKLVITAAQQQEASSGKAPPAGGNEKNPGQPNPPPQPGEKQPPASQPRNQEPNQQQEEQNKRPDEKLQTPMNADDRQGQPEQRSEKTEQQKGQQDKQQKGEGQQKSGQGQQGQQDKQQGGQQSNDKQQESGQQQGGQAGDKQQGTGQPQSGDQQSGQSGTQGSGGSKQQSNQPGGEQSGEGSREGGASGKSGGDKQGQPGGGDGQGKAEHDGQAIERIFKELQERGQQNQEGQNPSGDPKQPGEGGKSQQGQGEQAPMSGEKSGERSQSGKQERGEKSQPAGNEPGGQPQAGGNSGGQNANQPNAGAPAGNDQKSTSDGKSQQGQGKSGDAKDRLPDEKQGQNPSQQPSGGNKGGAPQGPSKTDKGEKSSASKGEDRDPGAGKTGAEGAGQASEDKTGSGPGQRKNADQKKEQLPDSNKAEKGEPSPASSSNRQSDSKGGESGQESGGGKKGAGQSAGQEGNDGAGSKSAAEQGAGQANETGGGETGSKGGQQQQASGKTGQSGSEKGAGSAKRAGNERSGESPDQQPGKGEAGGQSPKTGSQRQPTDGGTSGSDPVGGSDGGRERTLPPATASEEQAADAANLEYAKKATEMVLRKLKEEEHNPDPELLDKLGWTRDDLAEFLRRWDALQKSAGETPTGKRELDEALKSLGLRDPANRQRSGGATSDKQRDLRDAGNRSTAPPRYRELFDAFRKGAARSSP